MSLGGFSHLSVARKVILTAALMTTLILVSLVGISITQASKLAIATGEAGFSTMTRLIANNAAGGIRWNKPDAIEDRKSVVSGQSVSVRVDIGGRRIIHKNKTSSQSAHNIDVNS